MDTFHAVEVSLVKGSAYTRPQDKIATPSDVSFLIYSQLKMSKCLYTTFRVIKDEWLLDLVGCYEGYLPHSAQFLLFSFFFQYLCLFLVKVDNIKKVCTNLTFCSSYYLVQCNFHSDKKTIFTQKRPFQLEALYLDIRIFDFSECGSTILQKQRKKLAKYRQLDIALFNKINQFIFIRIF